MLQLFNEQAGVQNLKLNSSNRYDTYAERSPFHLSGGQMRRVAIAGVVAMDPDFLVL